MEALFVDGQVGERLGLVAKYVRGGEGGVDLGVIDIDVGSGFEMAEGEHAVFDGADAVEAPLRVDEGLGILAFDGGFGVETVEEFFKHATSSRGRI